MSDKAHPIQPIIKDENGVQRFKANEIVRYLIDHGSIDLNQIARLPFSDEDREQLDMLIGYSVGGAPHLRETTYRQAELMIDNPELSPLEVENRMLRNLVAELKSSLRDINIALEEWQDFLEEK
jgi:Tfp pilus assembly protein PilN